MTPTSGAQGPKHKTWTQASEFSHTLRSGRSHHFAFTGLEKALICRNLEFKAVWWLKAPFDSHCALEPHVFAAVRFAGRTAPVRQEGTFPRLTDYDDAPGAPPVTVTGGCTAQLPAAKLQHLHRFREAPLET